MKRLRKSIQWLLLLSLFVSNMPLIYAEEINQAIKQGQAEEAYKKAVTEASSQTVGSENANTEGSTSAEASSKPVKDGGDALQQPKVVNEESKAEAELKKQYGEPVAVSGQEQLFRVDETHFVTHIGSDIKTYIDQEGVEVPVDLSLYSYHANGKHYYLPKESPVGVVLPSEVTLLILHIRMTKFPCIRLIKRMIRQLSKRMPSYTITLMAKQMCNIRYSLMVSKKRLS